MAVCDVQLEPSANTPLVSRRHEGYRLGRSELCAVCRDVRVDATAGPLHAPRRGQDRGDRQDYKADRGPFLCPLRFRTSCVTDQTCLYSARRICRTWPSSRLALEVSFVLSLPCFGLTLYSFSVLDIRVVVLQCRNRVLCASYGSDTVPLDARKSLSRASQRAKAGFVAARLWSLRSPVVLVDPVVKMVRIS